MENVLLFSLNTSNKVIIIFGENYIGPIKTRFGIFVSLMFMSVSLVTHEL